MDVAFEIPDDFPKTALEFEASSAESVGEFPSHRRSGTRTLFW
jgi:hypothetical protein